MQSCSIDVVIVNEAREIMGMGTVIPVLLCFECIIVAYQEEICVVIFPRAIVYS